MVLLIVSRVYFLLGWAFLITGALFFFFPDGTISFLNGLGKGFGLPPAPFVTHRFWLSLGTAYMVLVTALSFLISRNPGQRRDLMLLLALGKGTSSLTSLWFFLSHNPYFVYLANFFVDLSLMFLALLTYRLTNPPPPLSLLLIISPHDGRIPPAIAEALLPSPSPIPLSAQDLEVLCPVETFHKAALHGCARSLSSISGL